jgi:hypothetical protein
MIVLLCRRAVLLLLGMLAWATEALCQAIGVGDCNADETVTVEEIVTLVRIALGETSLEQCPAGDRNDDGLVTIEEIVLAVQAALAAPAPPRKAFVTATDFQTGSFALVDLEPPFRV